MICGCTYAFSLMPEIFREEIFKNFSKHLWIDGYFCFKRFSFVYGEVVPVEYIQNTCAKVVLCFDVVGEDGIREK